MEDQTRLDTIHRRLGLFTDTPQDAKDPEAKGSEERVSDSEGASNGDGVSEKRR